VIWLSYVVINSFLHDVKKLLEELANKKYFYVNKKWKWKILAMIDYIKMKEEGG